MYYAQSILCEMLFIIYRAKKKVLSEVARIRSNCSKVDRYSPPSLVKKIIPSMLFLFLQQQVEGQ